MQDATAFKKKQQNYNCVMISLINPFTVLYSEGVSTADRI